MQAADSRPGAQSAPSAGGTVAELVAELRREEQKVHIDLKAAVQASCFVLIAHVRGCGPPRGQGDESERPRAIVLAKFSSRE